MTKFKTIIFTIFIFIHISAFSAETPNYNRHPLKEGTQLLSAPFRLSPSEKKLALYGGTGLVSLSLLDRTIAHHLFPFRNNDPSEDLRHLGDYGQVAGPAIGTLFGIQGMIMKNETSKETAYLSYESFVFAGALSGIIKFGLGRERPEKTDHAFRFKPFSGDSSFPSGHTTEAFAAATVFSEQYPHWAVIIPSYAAATAVGFSRMYANKHWMSDVIAGAFLGTAVSHSLRRWHRKQKNSDQSLQIDPSGVRWVKKF